MDSSFQSDVQHVECLLQVHLQANFLCPLTHQASHITHMILVVRRFILGKAILGSRPQEYHARFFLTTSGHHWLQQVVKYIKRCF